MPCQSLVIIANDEDDVDDDNKNYKSCNGGVSRLPVELNVFSLGSVVLVHYSQGRGYPESAYPGPHNSGCDKAPTPHCTMRIANKQKQGRVLISLLMSSSMYI